jgi:PAS domain S-box-containing protein
MRFFQEARSLEDGTGSLWKCVSVDPGHLLLDRHGAILEADAAFGRLMHVAPDTLRGRDVLSLTAGADRSECADAFRRLLETRRSFDMTKRFVRADTSVLWVRNSVSLMTLDRTDVVVATCAFVSQPETRRTPAGLLESARAQLAMIEDRRHLGDPLLLSGPNWTTLLEVFIAEAEGRTVDLASLSDHYGHSPEVVARWLAMLIKAGLLEVEARASDPHGEKSYRLTATATERLEAHLARFAREPEHLLREPLA